MYTCTGYVLVIIYEIVFIILVKPSILGARIPPAPLSGSL